MNVLVVDDDADVRELVAQSLKSQWPRANIVGVAEGSKGLLLMGSLNPDLIFLDINLPDISGYQVLRGLREHLNVPVIMLTGRSREEDIAIFLREGAMADDYVIKPFSPADLVRRSEALIRRSHGWKHLMDDDRRSKQKANQLVEGLITLNVQTEHHLGVTVRFVRQFRNHPDLRLLRMQSDTKGTVCLSVVTRQPIPLQGILKEMDGVAEVRQISRRVPQPSGKRLSFRVRLE